MIKETQSAHSSFSGFGQLLYNMNIIQLGIFLFTFTVFTAQCSKVGSGNLIHLLRQKDGSGGEPLEGFNCASWRLGVEAHNVIDWETVPEQCVGYLGHYLLGRQYREDFKVVVDEACRYVERLRIPRDDRSIWIFDVDETVLSNLPYYADHGFGVEPYNATDMDAYVDLGECPALPEIQRLYEKVLWKGINVVFLTGRPAYQWNITATNLKNVGFHTWFKLIVKTKEFEGKTAVYYKSTVRGILKNLGYRIEGSIGDQWSDILGSPEAKRSFKLPDPIYYIA